MRADRFALLAPDVGVPFGASEVASGKVARGGSEVFVVEIPEDETGAAVDGDGVAVRAKRAVGSVEWGVGGDRVAESGAGGDASIDRIWFLDSTRRPDRRVDGATETMAIGSGALVRANVLENKSPTAFRTDVPIIVTARRTGGCVSDSSAHLRGARTMREGECSSLG